MCWASTLFGSSIGMVNNLTSSSLAEPYLSHNATIINKEFIRPKLALAKRSSVLATSN